MPSRLDRLHIPILSFALLAVPLAHAHGLELFATVTDGVVNGRTYYADGPATGVTVSVLSPDGEVLYMTESGEDGTFSWTPTMHCDLRITAETPEGHRAQFAIAAAELPDALPKAEGSRSPEQTVSGEPPPYLRQLVEDAVNRQIRPLREQIDAAEHRTQLRDIVGGLGYIVGVAGLFAFWKSRTKRNDS